MGRKYLLLAVIVVFIIMLFTNGCTIPQKPESTPNQSVSTSSEVTPDATPMTTQTSPYPSDNSDQPTESAAAPIETDIFPIDNTHIPETTVFVNELDNGEKGLFYLGLTRDEVTAILKNHKITNYDMTEVTNIEGSWDWGNYVINVMIYSNNFQFFFDKQSYLLYHVNISGDKVVDLSTTQFGLKLGDTFDKMVQLYGDNYTVYETEDSGTFYEYKLDNHYFRVCFLFDVVSSWGISEYKFDKN